MFTVAPDCVVRGRLLKASEEIEVEGEAGRVDRLEVVLVGGANSGIKAGVWECKCVEGLSGVEAVGVGGSAEILAFRAAISDCCLARPFWIS
ncbi:hypothetical protein RCL_jg2763.t1 [Rhizophagus clarus]|uniref:Uncharacterized protein n=1 Tax=Rhizophagus clarus TaxID=94130 RepID=A0A8H3R0Y1_9GLOM|nr:hypothetical protein RCL_jg2763.t1 [Rhizophagus clarus]